MPEYGKYAIGNTFNSLTVREWDALTTKIESAAGKVMDMGLADELDRIHAELIGNWQCDYVAQNGHTEGCPDVRCGCGTWVVQPEPGLPTLCTVCRALFVVWDA